jgi:hypothetical protein
MVWGGSVETNFHVLLDLFSIHVLRKQNTKNIFQSSVSLIQTYNEILLKRINLNCYL